MAKMHSYNGQVLMAVHFQVGVEYGGRGGVLWQSEFPRPEEPIKAQTACYPEQQRVIVTQTTRDTHPLELEHNTWGDWKAGPLVG